MIAKNTDPNQYIRPLNMNGLSGRMLRYPTTNIKRKKEILVVYGHHSSIERVLGMAEFLAQFGNVTIPDLPGFGGMDSFYKIGKKPSLDNMADYLASFIKLRYKKQKITLIGMSYGFLVVTKMLQKYPELVSRVKIVVSLAGFAHKDDFRFKKNNFYFFKFVSWLCSGYLTSKFVQKIVLRDYIIRLGYKILEPNFVGEKHSKIRTAETNERKKRIDFEIYLWKVNDIRTYMYTGNNMLRVNLCNSLVSMPVNHVSADDDRYFDNNLVEEHMRSIYTDFILIPVHNQPHSTSVIATAEDAGKFFTAPMKALLRK